MATTNVKRIQMDMRDVLRKDMLKDHVDLHYEATETEQNLYVLMRDLDEPYGEESEFLMKMNVKGFPFYAPLITMMTPNGRFVVREPICMGNVSGYHQDEWREGTTLEIIIAAIMRDMSDTVTLWADNDSSIGHISYATSKACIAAKTEAAASSKSHNMDNAETRMILEKMGVLERASKKSRLVCDLTKSP
jgi:ubiquitin-protein ligase